MAAACVLLASPVAAAEPPAKLLYAVRERDTIVASNVLFSRTDRFRLTAQERVVREVSDNAVLVVETTQRLIGYSVYTAAWLTMALRAGESVEKLEAEDYSAFVLTNRRILNFNGRNGVWSESNR
jgi:hypothetical protein